MSFKIVFPRGSQKVWKLGLGGDSQPFTIKKKHVDSFNSIFSGVLPASDLLLDPSLEPQTTIYKWLFQLDDSQSLHRKWLFHQTSIYKWLFGVPGECYSDSTCFFPSWKRFPKAQIPGLKANKKHPKTWITPRLFLPKMMGWGET